MSNSGMYDVAKVAAGSVKSGDKADILLPTESSFWRNKNFISFSKLLRKVFGPNAGVFYMCRRNGDHENVFVTSSDMIIRL